MKLLSSIHRWAGGFIGLLLAVLGLSGALLVWEGSWVRLPGASDPVAENLSSIVAISERAAAAGALSRITFAGPETALHHIVFRDGSGAYARQDGAIVERWHDEMERPEWWLFDLHHHLFAGETGETITGIAGLAGIAFVVTGLILWWRSRRRFSLRLLPSSMKPGPIVQHHRDLGAIAAPLLLLSLLTGVSMLFPSVPDMLLGPPPQAVDATSPDRGDASAIESALAQSKARFPGAALRRISLPAEPGAPISVRLKQQFEWTPNGRTQLTFDGRSGRLLTIEDPALGSTGNLVRDSFYPVHSAKVGGVGMKLLMTFSGLALGLLGVLATYSFWFRRARRRDGPQRTARHRLGKPVAGRA